MHELFGYTPEMRELAPTWLSEDGMTTDVTWQTEQWLRLEPGSKLRWVPIFEAGRLGRSPGLDGPEMQQRLRAAVESLFEVEPEQEQDEDVAYEIDPEAALDVDDELELLPILSGGDDDEFEEELYHPVRGGARASARSSPYAKAAASSGRVGGAAAVASKPAKESPKKAPVRVQPRGKGVIRSGAFNRARAKKNREGRGEAVPASARRAAGGRRPAASSGAAQPAQKRKRRWEEEPLGELGEESHGGFA